MANGLYLGRQVDTKGAPGERLLLEPSDLLTHGLVVGMTGSGKTGLAVVLIEEVLRRGTGVIAIDPKGDLANLLLTFPELRPADFEPWVQEEDARRKGLSTSAFAEKEAAKWREGLAAWGQDGVRIRRLREAAQGAVDFIAWAQDPDGGGWRYEPPAPGDPALAV